MRKIILSLAAVALVATSCQVSPVEVNDVPAAVAEREVVAVASMGGADTKIAIDGDWNASWSANDNLGAYPADGTASYYAAQFTSDCEEGANVAEFTGVIGANSVVFMYPYAGYDIYYSSGKLQGYKVTSQAVDMENPNAALGASSLLLSGKLDVVDDKIEDFSMDYVNAFVNMNVAVNGLESGESIQVNALKVYGLSTSADIDPFADSADEWIVAPEGSDDGGSVQPRAGANVEASPIEVAVSNSPAYSDGDVISIPMVAFPSEVSEVSVLVVCTRTKADGSVIENQQIKASLAVSSPVAIQRAKYNTINIDGADFAYKQDTPVGKKFEVVDYSVTETSISLQLDINLELCAMVGVKFTASDIYDPATSFTSPAYSCDIIADADGWYDFGGYMISPGQEYKVSVVPVTANNSGYGTTYEFDSEEIEVLTITTTARAIGEGYVINIENVVAGINNVSAKAVRSDASVKNAFWGVVSADALADGTTLNDYIIAKNFLGNSYPTQFTNRNYETYEEYEVDELPINLPSDIDSKQLESGKDYILFVIGASEDGYIGEVNSVEFSTGALLPNDTEVEFNVVPTVTGGRVVATIPAGAPYTQVAAMIYSEYDLGYFTDESLLETLTPYAINPNDVQYAYVDNSDRDLNSEEGIIEFELIGSYGNAAQYEIALVAGDVSYAVGPLQKSGIFACALPSFDADCSVSGEITSVSYRKIDEWSSVYDVVANVAKGAGTVSYKYGMVFETAIQDVDNIEEWGTKVVLAGQWDGMQTGTEDGELTFQVPSYQAAGRLVIVPMDASGACGQPVVLDWESMKPAAE